MSCLPYTLLEMTYTSQEDGAPALIWQRLLRDRLHANEKLALEVKQLVEVWE